MQGTGLELEDRRMVDDDDPESDGLHIDRADQREGRNVDAPVLPPGPATGADAAGTIRWRDSFNRMYILNFCN